MTGIQSLEARTALGCVFAVAGYIAASSHAIHRLTRRAFDRAVNLAFILSRFGLFFLVFFVLHLPPFAATSPPSTSPSALPSCSIGCPTAASHPATLRFTPPSTPVSFFSGTRRSRSSSLLSLPSALSSPYGSASLASSLRGRRPHRRRALPLSAISLQFVTIDGQDNAVIAVLLGSRSCPRPPTDALSGAFLAAGAVIIKFLPLLFAPAFFLAARALAALASRLRHRAHPRLRHTSCCEHLPILFPFSLRTRLTHRQRSALSSSRPSSTYTPPSVRRRRPSASSSHCHRGLLRALAFAHPPQHPYCARRLRLRLLNLALLFFSKQVLAGLHRADALPALASLRRREAPPSPPCLFAALQRRGRHHAQHLGYGL